MIGFEIWLNGEHICTAGIEQFGCVSAITTWAKRIDFTSDKLTEGEHEEELDLNVAGLTYDCEGNHVYLKWINRTLEVGDEINIKIVQTSEVDKPISQEIEQADFIEEQQRKYYEKLKQKYEK
jgi:predicted RNA-binding protein with RPS1 domain